MELKFKADIKAIKKAFALMEMDIPSDEEIESKLSNVVVDLSTDPEFNDAYFGFIVMTIGTAYEL